MFKSFVRNVHIDLCDRKPCEVFAGQPPDFRQGRAVRTVAFERVKIALAVDDVRLDFRPVDREPQFCLRWDSGFSTVEKPRIPEWRSESVNLNV